MNAHAGKKPKYFVAKISPDHRCLPFFGNIIPRPDVMTDDTPKSVSE